MFDALSDRLERIAGRLRSRGRLSDADLDAALHEIRVALLEADVEVGVARGFVQGIRERCAGEALSKSLTPGQQVVKAVHEELIAVLGGETLKLSYAPRPPTVVLLAGLQGSGKTTTAAKLARWWKQQGRHPLLVGADLQRPAAVEQLRVLGRQIGVTVFSEPADPVSVARAGLGEARRLGRDICIVDTAGRLTVDDELMDEVRRVSGVLQPHYTFLVIDAMIGQDAVATARAFHESLELDGVILTKLDGDARGGAALSVKGVVGRPIVFASTGEKLGDFDLFHPDRMADRILGMGDILSLIEQAERAMDKESVARSAERLMEGRFTLDDFLDQLQQVKRLGSLGGVMKLLPGTTKELRQAAERIDDRELARVEAIMRSMTPAERADPSIIDGSRRVRIARGSGTATADVNQLLKQHREMQKLVKGMASGGGLPGLGGLPGGKSLGGAGGLLGSRRQLAALRSLGEETGADTAGLAGLLGGGARNATLPSLDTVASGGRIGGANGSSGARRGGKGKKKKGGRVTPPKSR
jgi:signal recognition particle subunit SRP54